MKLVEEIAELQKVLAQKQDDLLHLQTNCQHNWGEFVYDPDLKQVFNCTHYEGHGSDPIPKGNYSTEEVARWSRTCSLCGKKKYTYRDE